MRMQPLLCSLLVILGICLSGCGAPRAVLWHGPNSTPSSIAASKAAIDQPAKPEAIVPVYVATSREPQSDLSMPFGSARADHLHFARVDVGIPQHHQRGFVEKTGYKPNPAHHFAATALQPYADDRDFIAQINRQLRSPSNKSKEILVFIHGYNNNFADSTFRAAQLAYDYKLDALMVHYAWPSGGRLGLYVYDRDSADFARDDLAQLLQLLERTQAKKITVVAHSMGNFVLMEALRSLALTGHQATIDNIDSLLMASPDIDVDVFERQLRDIKRLPQPTAVMVSSRDRALSISSAVTGGHPRVGDGSSIELLRTNGVAVIDVSHVDGGVHDAFASSPTLMALSSDGLLSKAVLSGDGETPSNSILADGTSVVRGATSLILYTPLRLLSAATQ